MIVDHNDDMRQQQHEELLHKCPQDGQPPKQSTQAKEVKSNLKGDWGNFLLLYLLYVIQSLPSNISFAIPMVLQNRGVQYSDQAEMSFVAYPYVFKIIWAPIVDSVFISKFGRRKSWLIPTQFMMGLLFLFVSWNLDDWLGNEERTQPPNLRMLIITFFLFNLLSATQDVAVDGWSLTMLRRENVGHSGTCNCIGFATASLLGNTLFICLDSKDFCNRWLRTTPQPVGLVTFSQFLFFWAVVFFLTTTFILFFKKDNSISVVGGEKEIDLSVVESYSLFWKILRIKPVQIICLALITSQIGFGACAGVTQLKQIDAGVKMDTIALSGVPISVFQIMIPFTLPRSMIGNRSLTGFIQMVPLRLVLCIVLTLVMYFLPSFKVNDDIPMWYLVLVMTITSLEMMVSSMMYLFKTVYFSRVSDPKFGGTYLTLLNTVNNFAYIWPVSLALSCVDHLTWRKCSQKECDIIFDGYYIEMIAGMIITVLWYIWARKYLLKLKNISDSAWTIQRQKTTDKSGRDYAIA